MRREELDHVTVVEREPGRAESLGVCGEISAAARKSRLEIHEAIPSIAEHSRQLV